MQFRFTYEGPVKATQFNQGTRAGIKHRDLKHDIRMVFHRQLKALWEHHPALSRANDPFRFMVLSKVSNMLEKELLRQKRFLNALSCGIVGLSHWLQKI